MRATNRNPKNNSQTQAQQKKNLKAKCNEVRTALADADRDELLSRRKVGCIVREVMDKAKYGEDAVGEMEEELGIAKSTLYKYANISGFWPIAEFKALAKRVNKRKLPITWSHLELLADVEDGRVRKGLITRVLNKSLTVRQLGEIIPESKAVSGKRAPKIVSTRAAVRHLDRTLDAVKQQAVTWEKKVLPSLMSSRETLSETEISGLRSAWDSMNETKAVLDKVSEMLREVLTPSSASAPSRVVEAGPVDQVAAGA